MQLRFRNRSNGSGRPAIDRDRWSRDPETGEAHLVTFSASEGTLISTETYADRLTKRLRLIRDRHRLVWTMIIAFLVAAIARHYMLEVLVGYYDNSSTNLLYFFINMMFNDNDRFLRFSHRFFVFIFAAWAFFCALGTWVWYGIKLLTPAYAAGPEPVPPPGLEAVYQQMVYSPGGFANREEIDRAARGNTGTWAEDLTFED